MKRSGHSSRDYTRRTSLELSIEMHSTEDSEEYGVWQNLER